MTPHGPATDDPTALRELVDALLAQNALLTAQVAELQTNNEQLTAQVAELQAENEQLRVQNAELRTQNEALTARVAELEAENEELRAQVAVIPVLTEKLDAAQREIAELKRKITGRTTERTGPKPPKDPPRNKNDKRAQAKRRKNREARNTLPETPVHHPLDPADRESCSDCGGSMVALQPERSVEFEWVPGHLKKLVHLREKAICSCCKDFVTGPAPARVVEGGIYGPGFIARLVVQKVLDCVPLFRQAKALAREGLHVGRSTLVDQFHLAASLMEPLYLYMLAQVPDSRVVYADETSLKMQRVKKLGYIWTFATALYITYVFSPSRSGKTPEQVLGDSIGVLVVDGYTGYNTVTTPGKRDRAGCNSHSRRKFSHVDDDGAKKILELYKPVFAVEREAKERGIVGTEEHLAMRRARAGPAMNAIKAWAEEHQDDYTPKGAVGQAIRYFINQWEYLTRFLDDVGIAPENNLSERLLRIVALGRKNYLFVGHEEGGRNLAILASIVVTCVLHGVNPQEYLADALIRVQDHPASAIGDLMPHRWKALFGGQAGPEADAS